MLQIKLKVVFIFASLLIAGLEASPLQIKPALVTEGKHRRHGSSSVSSSFSSHSSSSSSSATSRYSYSYRYGSGSSSSSTRSSERRYMKRLRKYQPPKHVTLGLKSFKMPEKPIYRRRGLGSRISSNNSARRIGRRRADPATSSHSSSYSSFPYVAGGKGNNGCHKKKSCKRSKCRGRTNIAQSRSSSSSSSHSVSVRVCFTQEDAAILGTCDKPAIAFHHRHYSRKLCRSSRSRSRSRSRAIIPIPDCLTGC